MERLGGANLLLSAEIAARQCFTVDRESQGGKPAQVADRFLAGSDLKSGTAKTIC
jgi:hypothetical protein